MAVNSKGRDETVTLEVFALAPSGAGVAQWDGQSVLVQGVLPGEHARVIARRGEPVAREVLERTDASSERVTPPCPVFGACGGCAWQHAGAELQQRERVALLKRGLPPSLRAMSIEMHGATHGYDGRIRARMAWKREGDRCVLGFRARTSHLVVSAAGCLVLAPALRDALPGLERACAKISKSGEADLALGANGRPVVTLRANEPVAKDAFGVPDELVRAGFAGAALWPPDVTAPAVQGDPSPWIDDAEGVPLRIAPGGFSQAHAEVNAKLVRWVTARLGNGSHVLELYAGAGNFTVSIAKGAKDVTAVESDRAACDALRENLARRAIANVKVVNTDAESAVRGLKKRAPAVLMDPPRAGAFEACELFAKTPPDRLVYVSCEPATLGRDLGVLTKSMAVEQIAGFEMFPQTAHVETAVLLTRKR